MGNKKIYKTMAKKEILKDYYLHHCGQDRVCSHLDFYVQYKKLALIFLLRKQETLKGDVKVFLENVVSFDYNQNRLQVMEFFCQ